MSSSLNFFHLSGFILFCMNAEDRDFNGVNYLNCGDWVESCTALAEKYDGTFEIIYWDTKRKEYISEDKDKDKFTYIKEAS